MDQLDYHVVTLTWALKFPQIPRAHVPTLRRAPRVLGTVPARPISSMSQGRSAQMRFASEPLLPPFRCRLGPMRRRDYKKLKAGLWPVRKDQVVDMRNAEFYARLESVYQAQFEEDARRESFEEAIQAFHANIHAKAQSSKWENERSLLKFE